MTDKKTTPALSAANKVTLPATNDLKVSDRVISYSRVLFTFDDGRELHLKLKVSHNPQRKEYNIHVCRPIIDAHSNTTFKSLSFRVFEDIKLITRWPAGRYSEKKLRELFTTYAHLLNDPAMLMWAAGRSDITTPLTEVFGQS